MPRMPIVWSAERLTGDAEESMAAFRESRIAESGQVYADLFVESYRRVNYVLDATDDLLSFGDDAARLLSDGYYDVIRYLPAPPISEDDMYVIGELTTKNSPRRLALPQNVSNICDFVLRSIDTRRFLWLIDARRATEQERRTALVATASLMATQRLQTMRRNGAKKIQEENLKGFLAERMEFREVASRRISTVFDAPRAHEFCGETLVADKKADVVIGLGDNRLMCVECKVSNSKVNSFKRLNHETVEKTVHWYNAFGINGIVCAGLLSGVFSVNNLLLAQRDGVSIFWSHDLYALGEFVNSTFAEDNE